jgi:hypothetical protein
LDLFYGRVFLGRGSEELKVLSEGKASEDNLKLASGSEPLLR